MSKYWMKPETPRRLAEAGETFSRLAIASVYYWRRKAKLESDLCRAAYGFIMSASRFAAAAVAFDEECARFVRERGPYLEAKAEIARRMREWIPYARALVFGPKPKEPAPLRPVDVGIPDAPSGVSLNVRKAYGDAIADVVGKSARLLEAKNALQRFGRAHGASRNEFWKAGDALADAFSVFWHEDDIMRRNREGSGSGGGVGRV